MASGGMFKTAHEASLRATALHVFACAAGRPTDHVDHTN
jgi:hypothetical protein